MHTILLSGGSGKRLWPLSNDLCSKQYIKIVNYEDQPDIACSMLQRVWAQLGMVGLAENAVIAASTAQIEIIRNQLGENTKIAAEPDRRDTFPAVLLACAYVKTVLGAGADDFVAIQPVDPFVDSDFFRTIPVLEQQMRESGAEIGLIGARPTYPSQKYGYILPAEGQTAQGYIQVKSFAEKPSLAAARELLRQKALWNCGVFCFRLSLAEKLLQKYGLPLDYDAVCQQYEKLPKISFDYEVLEHAENLIAVPYQGMWKDLGTWNTLAEEMRQPVLGNVICDETCSNLNAVNVLDVPLVLMGARNMVVVASHDGILVADKTQSSYLKDCLKTLNQSPRYEERRWGTIKTIDTAVEDGAEIATNRVKIFTGMNSSYHCHRLHDEAITILSGQGEIILEGELHPLQPGDCMALPRGTRHSIRSIRELRFLETRLGQLDPEDIYRETFVWDEIKRK